MTARAELVGLLETLERAGMSVMALARGGRVPVPWMLFPGEFGVYDRRTRCQFYYHSHSETEHEQRYFHTVRLFPDHIRDLDGALGLASSALHREPVGGR